MIKIVGGRAMRPLFKFCAGSVWVWPPRTIYFSFAVPPYNLLKSVSVRVTKVRVGNRTASVLFEDFGLTDGLGFDNISVGFEPAA